MRFDHRRALFLLLAAGIAQRVVRWALAFPIWGDEAFLCLNVLERSPGELADSLRFAQVAPLVFLWIESACLHLFGSSECALRLPSLVAGIGSLFLFSSLAHLLLPRRAALFGVGLLAVSYYPVRHACEVKPYAFDLAAALVLMLPAAAWLKNPMRTTPMLLLVLMVPLVVASSYPSVFVGGAVVLALMPMIARQRRASPTALHSTCALLLVGSFALVYFTVAAKQQERMLTESSGYWEGTFPPADPLGFLSWLVDAHTGNLFAYPLGGRNGGSSLTFVVCVVGAALLFRAGRQAQLGLMTLPFLLTFAASVMHSYPYGGSARVAQHLAPSICLLAGLGSTAVLRRLPWNSATMSRAVVALLLTIAVGGLMRDINKPFKTPGDKQVRRLIDGIADEQSVVVWNAPPRLHPSIEWYLKLLGDRVTWVRSDEIPRGDGVVLRFYTNAEAAREEAFRLDLGPGDEEVCGCEVIRLRPR